MCGIAAILSKRSLQPVAPRVSKMLSAIKHRGPDGAETRLFASGLAIGSVRLAMEAPGEEFVIISNSDRSIYLAFNGEIYNWRDIRKGISPENYRFTTRGDGECVIALYLTLGISGLSLLDGMFSFILWDGREQKMVIARDRHGIKPLYVCKVDDELLICSEISGIRAVRPLSLNRKAIHQYLCLRYIQSPTSIFEEVEKLKPAEIRIINRHLDQCIDWIRTKSVGSEGQPGNAQLGDVLSQAAFSMASSDSKIGIFLSGGLDSSALAIALYRAGFKVPLFSIGYEGVGIEDETSHAKIIAKQIGASVNIITMGRDATMEAIEQSIKSLDEPLYSSVSPSTWALSRFAAQHVKGVLSGDGSDELLLGYQYIRDAMRGDNLKKTFACYLNGIGWVERDLMERLIPWTRECGELELTPYWKNNSTSEAVRRFEIKSRLSDYHLARVDRMSMAHGLEVRVPFLRNSVISACLSHNADELLRDVVPKRPLVEWVNASLAPIMWKREKQAFTAPVHAWMKNAAIPNLHETLLDSRGGKIIGLNRPVTENLLLEDNFYKHWRELWGLYVICSWVEHHL